VSDVSGGSCPVSDAVSQEQSDGELVGPTGVVVHDAHASVTAAMAPPARTMCLNIGLTAARAARSGNRHAQVHQQAMQRGLALEGEIDRLDAFVDGERTKVGE